MRRWRRGTRIGSRVGGSVGRHPGQIAGHRSQGAPRWPAVRCSRAASPRFALAPLLQSCGDPGLAFSGVERIPAPDDPVRWPLSAKHQIIESGLTPEPGSTLRIYNYADYLSPRVLKDFEKKYDVDIRLSTFNDADEALTKIATGNLGFDLYFPSYDSLGRLVTAELLAAAQPGLHDQRGQPVARLPATRGTTSAGCTPCPTRSTAPASAGGPTGSRRTSATAPTPTTSSGTRRTAATWRSSTTGTRRWGWCCCATASDLNTPTRPTSSVIARAAAGPRRHHATRR